MIRTVDGPLRSVDTPLSPGEREIFRREKIQVIASELGNLTVNINVSADSKKYVGQKEELFIEDGDVRIAILALPLSSFIIYSELDSPPVFIGGELAYTPAPV